MHTSLFTNNAYVLLGGRGGVSLLRILSFGMSNVLGVMCYSLSMDKVDLTKLFNVKFPVNEIVVSENSNFVNIRHDQADVVRANKYALKTKSAKIKNRRHSIEKV